MPKIYIYEFFTTDLCPRIPYQPHILTVLEIAIIPVNIPCQFNDFPWTKEKIEKFLHKMGHTHMHNYTAPTYTHTRTRFDRSLSHELPITLGYPTMGDPPSSPRVAIRENQPLPWQLLLWQVT